MSIYRMKSLGEKACDSNTLQQPNDCKVDGKNISKFKMKSFGLKNFSAVKGFQDGTGHKDALYKTTKRKISGSRVRGSIVFDKPGIRSRMMMIIIKDDHQG